MAIWLIKITAVLLFISNPEMRAALNLIPYFLTLISLIIIEEVAFKMNKDRAEILLSFLKKMGRLTIILSLLMPNLYRPEIILICIGGFLNYLILMFNNWKMPVDMKAMSKILFPMNEDEIRMSGWHEPMTPESKLKFLSDRIYLPFRMGITVMSIGDVIIYAGFLIILIKYS